MAESGSLSVIQKPSNEDVDRNEFYQKLCEVLTKKASNSTLLSREKYCWLIEKIKYAKSAAKKTPADYRRLKKFEIVETPDGERLYSARSWGDKRRQMVVSIDEVYDIIAEYHVKLKHGGRSRMMVELKRKYRNVTAESVLVYLSMCATCKNKSPSKRLKPGLNTSEVSENVVESCNDTSSHRISECSASNLEMEPEDILRALKYSTYKIPELCSRGQVDILSVTNEINEEYKYLMVYRNFISKFIHLKAMKTLSVDEAVDELLTIFLIFGAPNILQSLNGLALVKPICRRISTLCPQIKVVASDSTFTKVDFEGKSNEDILKKLNEWLVKYANRKWQEGVKFVQYELNTTFNEVLCRTPSEMVFGGNPKSGLASFMSKNVYDDLITEDDLVTVLQNKDPVAPKQLKLRESIVLPRNFIKFEQDDDSETDNEREESNI
ncbi:hypothetical protein HF086_009582 [Spodoptera exigua]|uniref:Integrase catalytic domain-containing protein n=1 Tax=Spodoptera exigua TaxID=7107 RepID=A0A922S985_SPOEX|nr:hypothetical protein HF086_009582 [Spodoptera exigua]